MSRAAFGWSGFGLRLLFALILVGASYNPSGHSYLHWAVLEPGSFNAVKALVGILLIVGWTIYLRATMRSLGLFGLLLASALFAALIWLLVDLGWINTAAPGALTYVILVGLALVMAIGISWSHVRRRLTGQVDADDVDE